MPETLASWPPPSTYRRPDGEVAAAASWIATGSRPALWIDEPCSTEMVAVDDPDAPGPPKAEARPPTVVAAASWTGAARRVRCVPRSTCLGGVTGVPLEPLVAAVLLCDVPAPDVASVSASLVRSEYTASSAPQTTITSATSGRRRRRRRPRRSSTPRLRDWSPIGPEGSYRGGGTSSPPRTSVSGRTPTPHGRAYTQNRTW